MKYKAVIGLEFHCEMKSNAKVFSKSKNSFSKTPNSHVAPLDMAFPGTLPILNKECVRKAVMMSLILNCKVPEYMEFDRKNYYYPDLPKGYQLTQFFNPVGTKGKVTIDVNGKKKDVYIHDIHLEEDSASLDHYTDYSLIDYNRAGVPLLELVTEPCLENADEAIAFLEYIKSIYEYTDISDCDTKKGQIRCDVNVSMMEKGSNKLGTKVEVKNVNNIGNVEKTIEYEIKRQTELINSGRSDEIVQETRRFDEATETTVTMRSKADAIDYKYFVEPNIPPYKISNELIEKIKKRIPILPNEKKSKYINELGLSSVDASIIIKDKDISDYFDKLITISKDIKLSTNWVINNITDYLNSTNESIKDIYLTPERLAFIINSIKDNKINSKQAKELFNKSLELKTDPKELISKLGMEQLNDTKEIEKIIKEILDNNTKQIELYKNGKTNMFDFFVGQVMKETRGKANPVLVKEILTKELENR